MKRQGTDNNIKGFFRKIYVLYWHTDILDIPTLCFTLCLHLTFFVKYQFQLLTWHRSLQHSDNAIPNPQPKSKTLLSLKSGSIFFSSCHSPAPSRPFFGTVHVAIFIERDIIIIFVLFHYNYPFLFVINPAIVKNSYIYKC